jgi:polyadenylate-binding protein
MIGTKPLYVALAQRKDVRRQALESQIAQRSTQRMQYAAGGPGYMGQPMYYPPMPAGYGQPGGTMPMRGPGGQMMGGPMMGYPGANPMMQQARPRYAPTGANNMPMGYGMMPPPQMYPPPNVRPGAPGQVGGVRPPNPAIPNGRSPVGVPQGLPPRGQMPIRPPQSGYVDPAQQAAPRLNAQALARASPADQKQMLGESLYPLIHV